MLHQTFCPLNNHFRHSLMMLRQFVKCGVNNFYVRAFYRFPEVRYFFRTFVNQKNNQMHVRIIHLDRLRHLLQQSRLTCLGKEPTPLWGAPFPTGLIKSIIRIATEERDISRRTLSSGNIGVISSKLVLFAATSGAYPLMDFTYRRGREFLILRLNSGIADYNIPCFQIKSADLAGRHIDIVFTRQVIGAADKTISVRHNLQNPVSGNPAVQIGRELLSSSAMAGAGISAWAISALSTGVFLFSFLTVLSVRSA